jgi:hypothetical protein
MKHAFAEIREIRESDLGYEEHGVPWVGLMQNVSADACDTPRERRERHQRDYVNPNGPVYLDVRLTENVCIEVGRETAFRCIQATPPFRWRRSSTATPR